MDIPQLKARLHSDPLSVARFLLPGGTLRGREYTVGNLDGDTGKSLSINTETGIWKDFADDGTKGGDLYDLFCAVLGKSKAEARRDVMSYLGVHEPEFISHKKTYKRPKKPNCSSPKGIAKAYLNGRGISDDTIAAYRIGENGDDIIFPFLRDGELIMYKVRRAVDEAKPAPKEKGLEPCLFGWQVVPEDATEIVITEGEIDALSVFEATGIPALSVPFGGGSGRKQAWIDGEYQRLELYEKIYLCLDQDEQGAAGEYELLSRLGSHRCYRVRLPRKDANECLQNGDDILSYINEATLKQPDELVDASVFKDQVQATFQREEGVEGYLLPWSKLHDKFGQKPGEVSAWVGKTNHGKSQVTSHVMAYDIRQGAKVCVASLEMHPKRYLHRLVRQIGATSSPTANFVDKVFTEFLADHLWCFNMIGRTTVDILLDAFEYAMRRFACDVFVIDSLMRLGVKNDDYAAQADAICKIVDFAVNNNVHVHLVCHARKSTEGVGTDAIRGAGEIADNCANIFIIWRNKELEEKMKGASEEELKELEETPNVILNLEKNRNGDWDGKTGLWFNRDSYRYEQFREVQYGYLKTSETQSLGPEGGPAPE